MILIVLFIFGLFIGSFLNVLIYRIPKSESIIFPPSHCPYCRHRLAWFDLFPVLSFLQLRGLCRYCKHPISVIYPIVELLTGLLFIFIYIFAGINNIYYLVFLIIMNSIFIVIFFTDLKYGIIPFSVVLGGCFISIIYLLTSQSLQSTGVHLLSALGASLSFLFLFVITKGRGLGFGDVVLVFLIGLFLGFPYTAFALYQAFLYGALVSVMLILIKVKKLQHDTIPFGPFLIIGTLASLYWGSFLMHFVMQFIPL
jgi:leader peptidase (prepilin peptidase) / N-methyltransferase